MLTREHLAAAVRAIYGHSAYLAGDANSGLNFAGRGHPCAVLYIDKARYGQERIIGSGMTHAEAVADMLTRHSIERRTGAPDRRIGRA